MRELKVWEIKGNSQSEVQIALEKALDVTDYDELFEVVEPFMNINAWHTGFTYWEVQPKLRAVC